MSYTEDPIFRESLQPDTVVHSNPSTWEEEANRSPSSRPVWWTEQVPGQARLHRETFSQSIFRNIMGTSQHSL